MPSSGKNTSGQSAAPIRSMTGFARVRRHVEQGEVVVSVKSVNHRGLDMHLHLPSAADVFDNAIRTAIKGNVRRGHVDVRLAIPDAARGAGSAPVNTKLLEQVLTTFREISAEQGLLAPPDLNFILRMPGILGDTANGELPEEVGAAILSGLNEALEELNTFRAREGGQIVEEMLAYNQQIAEAARQIEAIRETALAAFQERLTQRLNDLLGTAQIEPQRLAHEAAILADRSDIGEELARLNIHSRQLGVLLAGGGEVGKKLDFLLQEMNREANTILSKTNGIGETGLTITDQGLAIKSAIEKLREQSLNLE